MKQEFSSELVFNKERRYSNIWVMHTQNNSRYLRKSKKAFEPKRKLQPIHPYSQVLRHIQVLHDWGQILLNIILLHQCTTNSKMSHSISVVTSSLQDRLSSHILKNRGTKCECHKKPITFTIVKLLVCFKNTFGFLCHRSCFFLVFSAF